jgi:hypothetical protein
MKCKSFWLLVLLIFLVGCHPVATATPERPRLLAAMPSYLKEAAPGPMESYTLTEYEGLATSLHWGATRPAICVSIWATPFMEPGDFFGGARQWVEDRVYLIVDDVAITKVHRLVPTDSMGGEKIDPETGKVVWRAPDGSPMDICYEASLDVGVHSATLVVEKTSGEQVSYTWEFRITE